MANQRLTDKAAYGGTLALSDLIHIVDVSDNSQNAAGSSYKLTLSQLKDLINVNIYNSDGTLTSNRAIAMNTFSLEFTNGIIGIGTSAVSGTRLNVRGTGSTSATYTIKAEDSTANLNFYVRDDGAVSSLRGYSLQDGATARLYVHSTGGFTNTFIGMQSGYVNAGENYNTGIGRQSLASVTSGSYNFAGGYFALGATTTGYGNIGIGGNALVTNTVGDNNIGLGDSVMSSLLNGQRNIALGIQAGPSLTSESYNIIIGAFADADVGVSSSIALGRSAKTFASNQMVVGSAASMINDFYYGEGVTKASAGSDISFNITSVAAGQTDTGAGDWYFKGGKGTGTGTGSDLIFQVAPAGATGSTQNALVEILRLKQSRIINAYLQVGNASLASGDLYKDTAANILANGDYVIGMKV